MTDAAPPLPSPASRGAHFVRLLRDYLAGNSLVGRALMLAVLTLLLRIPLGMVDGVIADRQSYQSEATNNVRDSWGRAQTFVGPMIVLPYGATTGAWTRAATLLPEKLTIDGKLVPEQRRRGLFSVTVYAATLRCRRRVPDQGGARAAGRRPVDRLVGGTPHARPQRREVDQCLGRRSRWSTGGLDSRHPDRICRRCRPR